MLNWPQPGSTSPRSRSATGREIVQYAGRFGPSGWLSVGIIFVGFALLSVLGFELARVGQAYDYKRWIRLLIGPLWPLFDILLVVMLLLVIAVMFSAMGSILGATLGLPYGVGLAIAFAMVALINWYGTGFMERFKTFGSVGLYLAYLAFMVLVLTGIPAPESTPVTPEASTGEVVFSAIQYVGYNLAVFPAVLFCLYRQTERRETIGSGLVSAFAMTLPFALTFLCLMRFWPSSEVFDAEVPWLPMLEHAGEGRGGAGLWIGIFGVVAGWTLLETAVGGIHALVDRVERNLDDLPESWRPAAGRFSPVQRVGLSVAILAVATGLARLGIIDLVAPGY